MRVRRTLATALAVGSLFLVPAVSSVLLDEHPDVAHVALDFLQTEGLL